MNRREFLIGAAATGASATLPVRTKRQASAGEGAPKRRPNIVIYHSDQFRWDFLGANGRNGSTRTPNLDALAAGGVNFNHAITNQPVCAPSRSVTFTSRFATETGVWRNGLGLDPSLPTIAGELRRAGYTANYIGKWHLAANEFREGKGLGYVEPEHRGGFLDLWEASNLLEMTSHPYEGTIWDGSGRELRFSNEYRVDFLTERAERFLRQKQEKPFFLFISQLEPHQQNDMNRMVGPKGSAARFLNAFTPRDLREQPGDWREQLPDYYGSCQRIDASVGRIRRVLEEEGHAEDTIFVFMSDHGCHFRTRNLEYKRSTHNASLRVPLLIGGPGFSGPLELSELVGIIDLAPTLLQAIGLPAPSSWKGRSFHPLLSDLAARKAWPNRQLVQISESMTARTIRTKDWTYCVADLSGEAGVPRSTAYTEHQFYDQRNDPDELVNLAGRQEYRAEANRLQEELRRLIAFSGEPDPEIRPARLYP